jgi:hypothetical protein
MSVCSIPSFQVQEPRFMSIPNHGWVGIQPKVPSIVWLGFKV